jgi:hypothetical protein
MTTHCQKLFVPTTALLVVLSMPGSGVSRADVLATLSRVGNPIWRPVDVNLFTAPADTFDVFLSVSDAVLLATAPPSNPPYDNIITTGLASTGYQDTSIFLASDINGQPSGVYYAHILVPDPGTTGSSLDFASGPIIPNRLFPLTDDTDLLRNGIIVDSEFDAEYTALAGFDGYSHTTAFNASHAGFFPPGTELQGSYEFRSVLRDSVSGCSRTQQSGALLDPVVSGAGRNLAARPLSYSLNWDFLLLHNRACSPSHFARNSS